jgi:Integrase core domain
VSVGGRLCSTKCCLSHPRRRIVHVNITDHPTATWSAQQVVDAFPEDTAPRWLHRDRDRIYGDVFQCRIAGMGIAEVVSAPASPWQNPYVERLIGSIRRECLDHVIVLNEAHLAACSRSTAGTITGVGRTLASRKTRQIRDRSLQHAPGRSWRSQRAVGSITDTSDRQRKPSAGLFCAWASVRDARVDIGSYSTQPEREVALR